MKSSARDELGEERPRLGVALSGGGVRASLFAFGALMYLVESQENKRVAEISSVSGGSVTNAFVAQRCDFRNVLSNQFDDIGGQLARAIVCGLVTKRFVIATYGFVGLVVALVTLGSWPVDLPRFLDMALLFVFGALALLRGVVLTHLFQKQLFGAADVPKTLGSVRSRIRSKVAHVFCATDLNASMPVYFTTTGLHFYSPAWGVAEAHAAEEIPVVDAVRASAAFPFGIPPKRMDIQRFGVKGTPIQRLQQWQQLIFRDVREAPSVLYLADGGVWNNLGTDWFDQATRLAVKDVSDQQPEVEQLLVIDASAPTAAQPRLNWFWIPYYSELRALLKVWLVSYSSTVNGRIQQLRNRVTDTNTASPQTFVVRMIDPIPSAVKLGSVAWLGNPLHWSGRWSLLSSCWGLCSRLSIPRRQWVVRPNEQLHEWTSSVPTTFFSIPPEVALQLLMHGYLSTAIAMTGSEDQAITSFPGIERFAKILGLKTSQPPWSAATILGSPSQLEPSRREEELKIVLANVVHKRLNHVLDHTGTMIDATKDQLHAIQALREAIEADRAQLGPETSDFLSSPNRELRKAAAALREGNPQGATGLFDAIFAKIDLADEVIRGDYVARYAEALAASHDPRAGDVAKIAENRLQAMDIQVGRSNTALGWWSLAKAYAHLDLPENAVRSMREGLAVDSKALHWFDKEKNDECFRRIRSHPTLVAFEQELSRMKN